MSTWRRLDETRDLATIVVVERAGDVHAEPPAPGGGSSGCRSRASTSRRPTCGSGWPRVARSTACPPGGRARHPRHTASTLAVMTPRMTPLDRRHPASDVPASDASRRAGSPPHAAADKKGTDIVVLDVGDIISITEVFVLVSATNTRQVRTIVDEIELALKIGRRRRARAASRVSATPLGAHGLRRRDRARLPRRDPRVLRPRPALGRRPAWSTGTPPRDCLPAASVDAAHARGTAASGRRARARPSFSSRTPTFRSRRG